MGSGRQAPPKIEGDDFERGAQWLIALVRADIAQTVAPADLRLGLVAAGLLRTAELMEHSWVAHQNALHLPGQMLFRAIVDNWLVSRYLIEGPKDALDRVMKSHQGHRTKIGELTGLVQDTRIKGPPAGTKNMPQALQLAEIHDRTDGWPTPVSLLRDRLGGGMGGPTRRCRTVPFTAGTARSSGTSPV